MSERETTAAEDLKKIYDSVLKPLRRKHGKRGGRVLVFFAILVGVVMVLAFLTLPDPWNIWFLAGGIALLIFSPFLVFGALELFSLFAPRKHQSWKLGIAPASRKLPPVVGSPDEVRKQLRALDAWEFEEAVADIFGRLGYRTEVTQKTGDFGADVLMWDGAGTKWAVQVKHYRNPVGRPTIQAMPSVARDLGAEKAMVVTLSRFTKGASEYAESRGVRLVEGDELVDMYLQAARA